MKKRLFKMNATTAWKRMDTYVYKRKIPRLIALKWLLRGYMGFTWQKPVGSHITGYYLKGEKV